MRILIILLLFTGIFRISFGSCITDDQSLTEKLFQGNAGTIFTCKVLSFSTPPNPTKIPSISSNGEINSSALVEIITLYFGKVDTNIVSLRARSNMIIGMTYLIYTRGSGRTFSFGGYCDRWSKRVTESSEMTNELLLLKQFSAIFKNKTSGKFQFTDDKNKTLAKGQFKNGKPIKIWNHFYSNGIIKSSFDLKKNITSKYTSNGYLKSRITVKDNITFVEQFSDKVNGQLKFTDREEKNDTVVVMTVSEYYDNGKLKTQSSQINSSIKGNGTISTGKTGEYKEYYENGNLKVYGQYKTNKRIGNWKWYYENGEFNTEFDY